MRPYVIDSGSDSRRRAVEDWLFGLDLVSHSVREKIVTAWVSSWASSSYTSLDNMPFGPGVDYPLCAHVNEVTRTGMDLARYCRGDWKMELNNEILVPILMLHDVDKPLIYERKNGEIQHSSLYYELPHGVLGAMILKELDFPHSVVSTVALHAGNAPYHGRSLEAYILNYADYFSADHAMMLTGRKPFYQK